jgi:hypothetical protein
LKDKFIKEWAKQEATASVENFGDEDDDPFGHQGHSHLFNDFDLLEHKNIRMELDLKKSSWKQKQLKQRLN